jgi:PAS domain S-box-containing protein
VSDVQMPGVDGVELCALIKASGATKHIPIILITSHDADPRLKVRGLDAGADDFLMRPIDNVELAARVKVALRINRAESALRREAHEATASRDLFMTLADSSNDAVYVIDAKTARFLHVNDTALSATGYSRDELLAMDSVMDLEMKLLEGTLWEEYIERIKKGPEILNGEHKRKDGSTFLVEVSVRYLLKDGAEYLIAVARDVTERMRILKSLSDAEQKSRAWLANSPVCTKILDLDFNLQFMSDAGVSQLKIDDVTDYYGKPYPFHFFPDAFKLSMVSKLKKVKETGEIARMAGLLSDTQGNKRWYDHTLLPVSDSQGQLDYFMVISMDRTAQKLAEDALRNSYDYLDQIINSIGDPVFVKDEHFKFVLVNHALCQILGVDREALLGTTGMEILPLDEMDHFLEVDRKVLSSGEENLCEEVLTGSDGNVRTIMTRKTRYVDTHGVKFLVGVIRDITESRQAEENSRILEAQLRQSQKLESIGTLASGVAHEINNPINGIMNYAQLILDDLGPEHAVSTYATEIGVETQRVATIVKNLLSFARHDDALMHSSARVCDIVAATQSLISAVMRRDQIHLEVSVPEDLPQVSCRSQQIQQVVMNLLTNARDALNAKYKGADENKRILVTAGLIDKDDRQWMRVTVEDHGAGIPDDVCERMFDPFYTTKPRDKGTGLGLSISHGILKDHGGDLTMETEIGKWTRFHIDLPLANECDSSQEPVAHA